jgi:4-carboxymuconolactone decarboxylase
VKELLENAMQNKRLTAVVAFMLIIGLMGTVAFAQEEASAKKQTRAQQLFGDIAPKMAQLTDDVLYGDVWQRPELSKRDRSLVTVSALVAMNRPDQLRSHIRLALRNGLKKEEIVEAIVHLAFYSGWPNSVTAIQVAKEVFNEK